MPHRRRPLFQAAEQAVVTRFFFVPGEETGGHKQFLFKQVRIDAALPCRKQWELPPHFFNLRL